jgi:hypothetical protein
MNAFGPLGNVVFDLPGVPVSHLSDRARQPRDGAEMRVTHADYGP